jgi:large subunit ribosomal protein L29
MPKNNKITSDLSADELKNKVRDLEGELFKLRLQHATGQLEKTATLRITRHEIARAKTFLTQKAQG